MSRIIYEHGALKLEGDNKIHVLDFGERLMIKELIKEFYNYDTKFKSEVALTLHKERKSLNVYINENNAEDYYKAHIYDDRKGFIRNICMYSGLDIGDNDFNPTSSVMLTMLLSLEKDRNNLVRKALENPIKDMEMHFYICSEIARYIAEFLNRCGYEELPISIEAFIELYYDIIMHNSKKITFVGKEHKEDYETVLDLYKNTLTIEDIDLLEAYVKYKED